MSEEYLGWAAKCQLHTAGWIGQGEGCTPLPSGCIAPFSSHRVVHRQVAVTMGRMRAVLQNAFSYFPAVLRGIDVQGAQAAATVSRSTSRVYEVSLDTEPDSSPLERPVTFGQQILIRGEHFKSTAGVLCAFGRNRVEVPAEVLSDSEALCTVRRLLGSDASSPGGICFCLGRLPWWARNRWGRFEPHSIPVC